MSKNDSISMSVIRRLPRYYRFLSELNDQNIDKISSTKLAQIMNVTASQVRQDLNCFGGFGQQGYGYSVSQLKEEIKNILGLNNDYKAILIGAGNLGKAVAMHKNSVLSLSLVLTATNKKSVQSSTELQLKTKVNSTIFVIKIILTQRFCAFPVFVLKMFSISYIHTESRITGISATMI